MTLFRYKKNGLLYTIYKVTPRNILGYWYEVHPYNHKTEVGIFQKSRFRQFRHDMDLSDFTPFYTV